MPEWYKNIQIVLRNFSTAHYRIRLCKWITQPLDHVTSLTIAPYKVLCFECLNGQTWCNILCLFLFLFKDQNIFFPSNIDQRDWRLAQLSVLKHFTFKRRCKRWGLKTTGNTVNSGHVNRVSKVSQEGNSFLNWSNLSTKRLFCNCNGNAQKKLA